MVKVAIADDHKIFRDGLKLLFKKEKGFELIGEATNGVDLVEIVKEYQPEVILTDIKMPKMDGIEAVKEILSFFPEAIIIGLSMFDEEELVQEMFEAGAKGYLLKDAEKDEILEAIELVRNGMPCFSRTFSPKLVQLLAKSKCNPFKVKAITINEKERNIIELMLQDLTSKEIANELSISVRTVEWYKKKLMERLEAKSSTGIVIYAIKHNLVRL